MCLWCKSTGPSAMRHTSGKVKLLEGDVVFDSIHGETKDYAIVVSLNPEPEFVCYAVRNKTTFVDEYLSSNLAKARYYLNEIQKDLDEGFGRHVLMPDTFFGTSLAKPRNEPSGGGLNG